MTRRCKWLISGMALLALAVTISLPAPRWRMIGWWRGEAFYRGRPTSYYRPLCPRDSLPTFNCFGFDHQDNWPWVRKVLGDRVAGWLVEEENPLLDCGPDAVPVLVALLKDPDWDVRYAAVWHLWTIQPPAIDALPALRQLREIWDSGLYNPAVIDDCIATIEQAAERDNIP
jgi:hypothetical protein